MSRPKPTNPVVIKSKVSKEYSYSKEAPNEDNLLTLSFTLNTENILHMKGFRDILVQAVKDVEDDINK